MTTKLPIGTIKKIMKENTSLRVSDGAVRTLSGLLSDEAVAITKMAQKVSTHCGRKTIRAEDIQLTVDT